MWMTAQVVAGFLLRCFVQGSFANGYLEITANSSNKSRIDLHVNNPAPCLDCSLMCLNGTAGQAYPADFAIISKTLNMYGATQIVCSGGNAPAVNDGNLSISERCDYSDDH